MGQYAIPAAPVEHLYQIKKSQFISRVAYAQSRAEALEVLAQAKKDYPDARHHCWAYLIGDAKQPTTAAFSDDGEPAGTAGKPILNVLNHKNIGDIVVVVVRYFGGIKLGAGGLVRAYSTATQQAIDKLCLATYTPRCEISLNCGYADELELRRYCEQMMAEIIDIEFNTDVALKILFPEAKLNQLKSWLACRSGIKWHDMPQEPISGKTF